MSAVWQCPADRTLAALAFAEAVLNGQRDDWGVLLDTTCCDDLIIGLVGLSARLLQALADATDRSVSATVEMERAVHLFTAAGGAA